MTDGPEHLDVDVHDCPCRRCTLLVWTTEHRQSRWDGYLSLLAFRQSLWPDLYPSPGEPFVANVDEPDAEAVAAPMTPEERLDKSLAIEVHLHAAERACAHTSAPVAPIYDRYARSRS